MEAKVYTATFVSDEVMDRWNGCGKKSCISLFNCHIPWCARNHEAAKAAGVRIVGDTHYSTEKYAVMEMVKFFEGMGLESAFLPETPNFEEL